MQESSRAERDGAAFVLYQEMQLMHVEKDVRDYIKSKECRRNTCSVILTWYVIPKILYIYVVTTVLPLVIVVRRIANHCVTD